MQPFASIPFGSVALYTLRPETFASVFGKGLIALLRSFFPVCIYTQAVSSRHCLVLLHVSFVYKVPWLSCRLIQCAAFCLCSQYTTSMVHTVTSHCFLTG